MSISDVLQFSMAQTVDLDESLVQTLIFVRRVLSPTIKHIYYPWCKKDISVATAFPESVVTHVCRTSSCVQALRANHLRAFCQDPNTYRPKRQQDILMLLDPETMPPIMFQTLADTGIVLASYAGATAEGVYVCREAHGLVFSGAVVYRDKEPTYVTDRLEDFGRMWKQMRSIVQRINVIAYEIFLKSIRALPATLPRRIVNCFMWGIAE